MQVSSLMVASDADGIPSAISSMYVGIFSFVGQALMHGAVTETRYWPRPLFTPSSTARVEGLPEIGERSEERVEAGLSYLALRPFLDVRGRDSRSARGPPYLPCPSAIRFITSRMILVPTRHGMHLPHDSFWTASTYRVHMSTTSTDAVHEHEAVPAHERLYRLALGELLGEGEPRGDGVIVFRSCPCCRPLPPAMR